MNEKQGRCRDMKTYTLDQIKKAFWAEFHKGGERWFNYLGTEEDNESSTESAWKEFSGELNKEII